MLEGGLIFSLNSLVAGSLCVALGAYVYRKNPYLMGSQLFIALMSFAALNAIAEFFMINAPDEGAALIFSRLMLFLSLCAGASLLYLACHLPYDRANARLLRRKRPYLAVSVVCAAVPALAPNRVIRDQYGWWTATDATFYLWLGVALAYCSAAVLVVVSGYRKDMNGRSRARFKILLVGVAVLPVYGALEVTANVLGIHRPPILSVAVLSAGMVFAVALFKHGLFDIEPVKEDGCVGSGTSPALAAGRCTLVEGKKGETVYRMVMEDLAAGGQGMLITRLHPERVREKYGLTRTPTIWLSTQPGQDRIDPACLSILQHTIVDFLQKSRGAVVLLDGIEYLFTYNPTEKVLRLVYAIKDATVMSGSKFIVPLDPKVMDGRNLAFLEREFDVLMREGAPVRD